jgi:hypothetical protein
MWGRSVKRAILFMAVAGVLLVMSVGPGLAQPEAPADATSSRLEGGAAPVGDSPIGAQAAPSASIAAPSAAIGDFGASQGNVWDMDSTSDIVWTQEPFTLEDRPGTVVRGYIPPGADLAIAFYTSSSTNLPTSQYHHLTYKLKIAAQGSCATNGRIIYTKSWPNWLGSQVSTYPFLPHVPPMSCPFGQDCIYYMDLARQYNYSGWPTWPTNPPTWLTDGVKAFGMWPHERWANCGGGPAYFDLDYVYLTGDIVAREEDGYVYTVKWNVSDTDGGMVTSILRYQEADELQLASQSPTCNDSNFSTAWTYITQQSITVDPSPSFPNQIYLPAVMGGGASGGGAGLYNDTYDWDLSSASFEDGKSYYLCIRVDDGTSHSYAVSSAPVIRVPRSPYFGPN